jgi:hypothetical protein
MAMHDQKVSNAGCSFSFTGEISVFTEYLYDKAYRVL